MGKNIGDVVGFRCGQRPRLQTARKSTDRSGDAIRSRPSPTNCATCTPRSFQTPKSKCLKCESATDSVNRLMDARERMALDRHITGNYGEDSVTPEDAAWPDGVYQSMPANEYHAAERLSSGGARKILQSQLHYLFARNQPNEPTAAMEFGSAVHFGVLEPDTFMPPTSNLGRTLAREQRGGVNSVPPTRDSICLTPDGQERARASSRRSRAPGRGSC